MSLNLQGRVGPLLAQDGAEEALRQGKSLEAIVGDAHGKYFEGAGRGNVFAVGNSAGQATSTASLTATGLNLFNPLGNNKALVIQTITVAIAAAVAAVSTVALFGTTYSITAPTHTATLTPRNVQVGNAATPTALADSSSTLVGTIYLIRPLMGATWITGGTATSQFSAKDDVAGEVIVLPGSSISIQSVVSVATVVAGITWEEIPLGQLG